MNSATQYRIWSGRNPAGPSKEQVRANPAAYPALYSTLQEVDAWRASRGLAPSVPRDVVIATARCVELAAADDDDGVE